MPDLATHADTSAPLLAAPAPGTDSTTLPPASPAPAPPAPVAPVWSDAMKEHVRSLIARWQPILLLQGHNITVVYSDVASPDGDSHVGQMISNHPYIDGHELTLYPSFIKDDREYQSRVILHELLHVHASTMKHLLHAVLVKEALVMWREVKNADEHLVDTLTSIVLKLVNQQTSGQP